ncbi:MULTISPECIES: AAA family ATPase [unclassified Pseudoalteromonas]|uniref:AAA family ATPase n=1 Tax=unclassified Pseudoalteromonas TaxID=194690 RepID=UPI001B3A1BBD|nr:MULTISPECIES: AAA family ATPase [unclassified Pseudoalteromonas]MBQ4846088.1 AAA family ATPase [Pseudoalteromonas sp. MMG005]MBQ4851578.1 AAA family ATPase [Pseudoalteromonas sp. MMG012]
MNLIPHQYQEVEDIGNEIIDNNARCVTFISLEGNSGSSTVCASVAQRFKANGHRVLIIDLNPINPLKLDEIAQPTGPEWCFSDITCQLNIIEHNQVDLLTMQNLSNLESAKNKQVMKEAVERLSQEYNYILLDMSPATKMNRGNVPLHALSLCSDMTIVTVGLGINDEESLCTSIKNIKQGGHQHVRVVVTQHHFAPLGEKLINALERHRNRWPRITQFLINKVNRQTWLFHPH